jgi:hypothetical protein
MTLSRSASGGQSIVETVVLLPAILSLLAGAYWSYRHLSLSGSAESASMAHMIRSGRKMPGIDDRLARTILPGDNGVAFRAVDEPLVGQVPLFRGMTGRTRASVDVSCPGDAVGGFLDLPGHDTRREAEGAVDCWGSDTRSGKSVRKTVQGIALSGAFR